MTSPLRSFIRYTPGSVGRLAIFSRSASFIGVAAYIPADRPVAAPEVPLLARMGIGQPGTRPRPPVSGPAHLCMRHPTRLGSRPNYGCNHQRDPGENPQWMHRRPRNSLERPLARGDAGQAAVEAALTLPLAVFLVLGTLQLFLMLQARLMA